jgi:uncharacterized glyoxalase superfamily protein PhnB
LERDVASDRLPFGYHNVTPFLIVDGVQDELSFMCAAFGAVERERITKPDGRIGHAEVQIGDSVIMLSDASDALPARPSAMYLYVDDVDAAYSHALNAGATSRSAPADQFYGNRESGVIDPAGNIWWIASVIEEVRPEDLQARFDASQM